VTTHSAACPAKINLGLKVIGRRPDGYHEIVTIFQTVDLVDRLEVVEAPALTIACDAPGVPTDASNHILRAAEALRRLRPRAAGRGAGFRLRKAIPAGGGLGGGSSDAAGAILLLDRLWDLALTRAERFEVAASLGSDVSFFLTGGTALGTGRGEIVRSLPPIRVRPVVLGLPPFGLATPAVYAALRAPLTPVDAGVTVPRLFVNFAEGNDFARATNDLEGPAFVVAPELATFRDALSSSGAEPALLSGSGSTVFGLFRDSEVAAEAARALAKRFAGWTIVATTTADRGARIVPRGGG
jgi:4-diphosphocytidyl-2-C-methyl-D-erythritol kinase